MIHFLSLLVCTRPSVTYCVLSHPGFYPAGIGGDGLSRYRTDFHEIEVNRPKYSFDFYNFYPFLTDIILFSEDW